MFFTENGLCSENQCYPAPTAKVSLRDSNIVAADMP